MMTFLRKSKFPMINIAILITITNQNRFLLWSDVFIFRIIHYFDQGISVWINCPIPSPVSDTSISYSPCTLYFCKLTVTPANNTSDQNTEWVSKIWLNFSNQQIDRYLTNGNLTCTVIITKQLSQIKCKVRGQTQTNISNTIAQHVSPGSGVVRMQQLKLSLLQVFTKHCK
jgi:hypothetical protein